MFEAKLKIDGEEFEVLQCQYTLERDTDSSGQPSNNMRGGKVHVVIKSSSDTRFFDWATNPYAQKDGEIEFYKRNDPTPAKVLKFAEAYIVEQGEKFDVVTGGSDQPMVEYLTFSARTLTLGETFENTWAS